MSPSEISTETPIQKEKIDQIINRYSGNGRGLIELLQEVSKEFGYLPRPALEYISERLEVPLSRIYSISTFYQDFKLQPSGKHKLHICSGTACHVKGSAAIVDMLCRRLNIKPGETTDDGLLTLETVNCVGLCGVGPVAVLDGEYHSDFTSEKALELVDKLQAKT